jgi:hypothetical protein
MRAVGFTPWPVNIALMGWPRRCRRFKYARFQLSSDEKNFLGHLQALEALPYELM